MKELWYTLVDPCGFQMAVMARNAKNPICVRWQLSWVAIVMSDSCPGSCSPRTKQITACEQIRVHVLVA